MASRTPLRRLLSSHLSIYNRSASPIHQSPRIHSLIRPYRFPSSQSTIRPFSSFLKRLQENLPNTRGASSQDNSHSSPSQAQRQQQQNAISQSDIDLLRKLPQHPRSEPSDSTASTASSDSASQLVPTYELIFTCKICTHRSAHRFSKQGYHNGTILIQCPSCKNRHLIADHLKIFSDKRVTLEDILSKRGELVRKPSFEQQDGDLELYPENMEQKTP